MWFSETFLLEPNTISDNVVVSDNDDNGALIKKTHVIIFENYNECKTKHLFLIRKVLTRFDKKNSNIAKKSTD